MKLTLYNSLLRRKEAFAPINAEKVTMYVCGPTVYDHIHIGNARSAVVYDLLYRLLLFAYPSVLYVRNITDVDDKIIERAQELNISLEELTSSTTDAFLVNMKYLNCLEPTVQPKATQHISDMIYIIQRLLQNGSAYCIGKDVYFSVNSFKDYTQLSGRNLNQMIANSRHEYDNNKKDQEDFVLWKGCDQKWASFDSPWGLGRPGWHIECSAMSYRYLGHSFDIHGGGVDLIFPHHTNEIAQSKCAFEHSSFARYWVHNGFVMVNGEKMSKSLNNFITVKELRDRGVCGDALRLALLATHYHKPMNFSEKLLADARKTLDYCYAALNVLHASDLRDLSAQSNQASCYSLEVLHSLTDDLNTPQVITYMHAYAKKIRTTTNEQERQRYAQYLLFTMQILGLQTHSNDSDARDRNHASQVLSTKDVSNVERKWMYKVYTMVIVRRLAKQQKKWATADSIRQTLLTQGVLLTDNTDGTTSIHFESL